MVNQEYLPAKEENIVTLLTERYAPYWPLFIGLLLVALVAAWGYLRYYATPVYEASATLIIKDENKGVDESQMAESMNMFNTKKIIENEIEVIKSRGLMKKVVHNLHLYAPIYEDNIIKDNTAYSLSPVTIQVKDPDKIKIIKGEQEKIYFAFNPAESSVSFNNTSYPLHKWVNTPYGKLKFEKNFNGSSQKRDSLYFVLVNPKVIVDGILEEIEVSAANKLSSVVNITLKDANPQRGEDILNHLISAYNQEALADRANLASNTLAFIEDRIKYVEDDLNALEKEVQQYRSTKGVIDLSEQGRLYLQNVGDNDRKISDLNMQIAVLDKVEKYVVSKDNRTGIVPSTLGVDDPVLSQLLEKLYNAELEYEKLSKTVAKNNPMAVSVANEIEKIRPGILENIQSQRSNLKASLAKLNSTNGSYNAVLQSIPQKERELLELTRKKAIKNELFSFLLQKREETALSHAPSDNDTRVVDMAESSPLPVSPKPLIVYAVASILALGAGFTLIAGKEVISNKILFRADIEENTSIPVIGELLHVSKKSINETNDRLITDQFRDIRLATGLYGTTIKKQAILITSSMEGEGKSFVSENLAKSIASSGKRVVLINFDMQKPFASDIFTVEDNVGIAGYLTDGAAPSEIVNVSKHENLFVIPGGKTIETATSLLLDTELKTLFSYLRKNFDYIVIDTPPVGVATDAFVVAEYCDTLLYVVRHGYTPKKALEFLERNVKLYEVNNLAIVFNDIKSRGFVGSGYGMNYGYGYKNINQYSYQRAT